MVTLTTLVEPLSITIVFILLFNLQCHAGSVDNRKVYIVYLQPRDFASKAYHLHILKKVLNSSCTPEESLVYSYRIINGFAARLTDKEVKRLESLPEVASVSPNKIYKLDDNGFKNKPMKIGKFVGVDASQVVSPSEGFPGVEYHD